MNKKILVTGADGFIGSHLTEALVAKGCEVRALVHYNSFSHWGWLESISKDVLRALEIFPADIRDPISVHRAVKDREVVFHLAALVSIPYSYESPDSYLDTNIRGTLNVLQSARDLSAGRVLITSTSEVYGTAQYVPIDESHPLQGQSPYSASKIAADKLAESYHRSFGVPVITVRPFNTYGPRQSARAVIPSIIIQLLSDSDSLHLGNIKMTRDFNYVEDTVQGFISIAESDRCIGQEINIATEREYSILDIAQKIMDVSGRSKPISYDQKRTRPDSSEVFRLLGSNKKIKELTNWQSLYCLEKGLKLTYDWFSIKSNLKNYKSDLYNI